MSAKLLAIALWLGLSSPAQSQCLKNCVVSDDGLRFIQEYEGYSPFVYRDVAGIRTVGFGHALKGAERFDEPFLPEQAAVLLRADVSVAERGLNRCVAVPLYQHQADPTISIMYNAGVNAICASTLVRYVNAKRHAEVPAQFMRWDKATINGRLVPVKGLTRRREAEAKLYAE